MLYHDEKMKLTDEEKVIIETHKAFQMKEELEQKKKLEKMPVGRGGGPRGGLGGRQGGAGGGRPAQGSAGPSYQADVHFDRKAFFQFMAPILWDGPLSLKLASISLVLTLVLSQILAVYFPLIFKTILDNITCDRDAPNN